MTGPASLLLAFREADTERRIRFSLVGSILALVLIPAGSSLDYLLYPEHFYEFLYLRFFAVGVVAAVALLHLTALAKRAVSSLMFAWLVVPQVMICYMIFLTEGYASSYYAGLNLAILGMGVLLPSSLRDALAFCALSIALYLLACLAHNSSHIEISILFNNLYFLFLTSIISAVAVYFNARNRFNEFRLTYELDARNKELAELDRLKSEFFANISHELRTPLTLILSPIQDLLQSGTKLPDHIASLLSIAEGNALRLLKLVNDLLDIIRLEEGRASLRRDPIDMVDLVRGIITSTSHLAENQHLSIHASLPEEGLIVSGDLPALEKVFFNVLSNAIKFTPGGGSIRIICSRYENAVVVQVIDTGIGIGEKDLPYVFDRFRQADGSTTRAHHGTGLGLALVKEITEQHDGSVSIESQRGTGTTVTITVPLDLHGSVPKPVAPLEHQGDSLGAIHRAAEQAAALPTDPPDEAAVLSLEYSNDLRPRVLIVDDEPDMRRYLAEILGADYRLLIARDGRQAVENTREKLPDLIVLDLMLPEMNGLEVCRLLKADSATRHIKIILLTARVDETAKLTALENGADDFLTKPFSSLEVKTRLRNLIRSADLERELKVRNSDLEQALRDLKATEAQLIQSEKLNALGTLAAGLLHEINNPLNFVHTAVQIAQGDTSIQGDEMLRDLFADIDEGVRRIRSIVSDLRAFAYPSETDKRSVFPLSAAVNSAMNFTAHELKSIRVEQDFSRDFVVQGSRSHIVQILVNLLTNAARAIKPVSSSREGQIRIQGRVSDGRVYVSVWDNGVGIDAKTLGRIFEPFFTTRDVGQGMGLGLSICHTIVANHGGKLTARSQPGEWTEMSFDLPLADTEATALAV